MKSFFSTMIFVAMIAVKGFGQLEVSASNAAEAVGRLITITDKCYMLKYNKSQKSWLFVINNEDFENSPDITVAITHFNSRIRLDSLKSYKGKWVTVDGILKRKKGKLVIDGDAPSTKIRQPISGNYDPSPLPPTHQQ